LQPQKYFSAAHVCGMLLKIRTIVTEFVRTLGWAAHNSATSISEINTLAGRWL
jgi:hypothetical protein